MQATIGLRPIVALSVSKQACSRSGGTLSATPLLADARGPPGMLLSAL